MSKNQMRLLSMCSIDRLYIFCCDAALFMTRCLYVLVYLYCFWCEQRQNWVVIFVVCCRK